MTAAALQNILESQYNKFSDMVDQKIQTLMEKFPEKSTNAQSTIRNDDEGNVFLLGDEDQDETANPSQPVYRIYPIDGKFFHVPSEFKFPEPIKLNIAWRLWTDGLPSFEVKGPNDSIVSAPIRPFQLFKPKMLPKAAGKFIS